MKCTELQITFPDGKIKSIQKGTPLFSVIDDFSVPKENIIGLYINNKAHSLNEVFEYNSEIRPVLNTEKNGSLIYRRSLCNVLAYCSQKLFPNRRLLIGHSISHGYYYTYENIDDLSEDDVKLLKTQMQNTISKDIPIETLKIPYNEAYKIFKEEGLVTAAKQLEYYAPPVIKINKIEDYCERNFGPCVKSTGCLKVFDIKKYGNGFLLRFPLTSTPEKLTEFSDEPKLFSIYSKYKKWGSLLNVTSVASLNSLIINRKVNDFVNISETFQERNIADIASQIASRKQTKVVLIAGPSSSGKTTTSKKLSLQLQAIGFKPKIISLDNYYLDHSKTPRDENGNLDFECLEALDIDLLNKNLIDLFDSKEVIIPSYNFQEGKQNFDEKNKMKLEENEILIMEGIHGLNDRLTPKIPNEYKFKIYLSALTQLNLDDHTRISTSDNRLIRRIVRDAQFRGKPADGTIAMWPSVRKGEEKHIYPFHNNADAILNTALDYELSVLKTFAEPLLKCVKPNMKEYAEACRLLKFLENFATIPPTAVPGRSIIREFIGNSSFKY